MEYAFNLTGRTALLIHKDDVEFADMLKKWQQDPANREVSVRGDDRSPPWAWHGYLHHDGEYITMPSDVIMATLANAGTRVPRGKSNFKAMSQSGLFISEEHCALLVDGERIPKSAIDEMMDLSFSKQCEKVQELGFKLFVKRARIGTSKHVRVRPRFDSWSVEGTIEVLEPAITPEVLGQLFDIAGRYYGFMDWAPHNKKPGPFGTFTAKLSAVGGKAKRVG